MIYMVIKMNIEKLKDLRENQELTMQDLANQLNIAKSSYSLWEEGIERIPLERLISICDFFNVSLDYLMDNTNTPKYQNSQKGLDKNILKNNLKILRKDLKYTQDAFAKLLNLNRTTIINYEKGLTIPLLDHLLFISKNFNISLDYLLGKTKEPKYLKK